MKFYVNWCISMTLQTLATPGVYQSYCSVCGLIGFPDWIGDPVARHAARELVPLAWIIRRRDVMLGLLCGTAGAALTIALR